MTSLRFGSDTEHVEIDLPHTFDDEGWATVDFRMMVPCFVGWVNARIQRRDLVAFHEQLESVHHAVAGVAILAPLERQIGLRLEVGPTGVVAVSGHAWSKASYENKLEFEISLDQTYLRDPLELLGKYLAGVSRDDRA